ncbi:ubiquitin carboxyl-terminal hydrolase isozyme L3-like isoform X2 [Uloborus diversus]|uniref:ubiquitin carboxyl-terminal hydrolase isozyme L3-like isoform X2 n=1 Tax=Uloborus diversus TaxID=327109 RepID=UPI002409A97A|nr:ubiquitin carboxyl-terminal hydrolase isozyme L3-like isoform X2 [Uloborus diversus]
MASPSDESERKWKRAFSQIRGSQLLGSVDQETMAGEKRWLPLESNPEFLSHVGVPEDFSMVDVIDLDDEHLEKMPKKVLAVLLLFPTGEQHEQHCASEQETIDSDGQVVSDRVYFIKLDADNASGTVALVHAVANAEEELQPADDSPLKEFIDRTKDMSPEERGQELEMDETLCCVHETMAKEGQTEAPEGDEETKLHFITFVALDEQLYELDAHKNYPINHGSTSMDTLLKDAVAVCKAFMERDPDNLNFSIMALVSGPAPDTEEEEVEE